MQLHYHVVRRHCHVVRLHCHNVFLYCVMTPFFNYIRQQLSVHLNQPVEIKSEIQVFGGDINQTFQLETSIGSFFLKLNDISLKDMFEQEFAGLQLLHQTKTLKIPAPVLYGSFEDKFISLLNLFKKSMFQKTFGKHSGNNLLLYIKTQPRSSVYQQTIISVRLPNKIISVIRGVSFMH